MVSANFASTAEHLPNMSQLARAFTTIGKRSKKASFDDYVADSTTTIGNNNNLSSSSTTTTTFIGRAASQRAGRPVLVRDISSPLALMSTSNVQVHNAKHIEGTKSIEIRHVGNGPASTASSASSLSGDDSDNATVLSGHDVGALTDASSVDESPSPVLPTNHLSCYFKPSVDTAASTTPTTTITTSTGVSGLRRSLSSRNSQSRPMGTSPYVSPILNNNNETFESASSSEDNNNNTPNIPQRVPSHSKRAHERLHRTRSLQRMISPPPSGSSKSPRIGSLGRSSSTRSIGSLNSNTPRTSNSFVVEAPGRESAGSMSMSGVTGMANTPFGSELAQLDEIAEEFGMVVRKASHDLETDATAAAGQYQRDYDLDDSVADDADDEAERALIAEKGLAVFGAEAYCHEISALVEETFGFGFGGGEGGWF